MQFTESEIQEILRENQILKQDLNDAREELEATARLYDAMVVGTRNLLLLIDEGGRGAVYVSPNVEEVLGLPRELVMSDIRELGPKSGDIPCKEMFDSGLAKQSGAEDSDTILHSEAECIDRRTGLSKAYHRSVARLEGIRGNARYLVVYLDAESGTADNSRLHEILYDGTIAVHNRMLKGMSHDLRTPLNSIAGFVMLLMKNAENSAKVMEYAHRISVSCQDLLVMINQIMEMSGTDRNSAEADKSEFALGSTIEEVSELVKTKAQLKHQRFEVNTSGIEHDIFLGDKVRITEVLMNLLNNALQYTPEGGEISLSVIGRKDGDSGYREISFEIRDNGIGMSSELQKRLFDNVGRFDDIPGMQGSGLGIAISRKFVAQMGGTISVQSTLGQGTTFFVGLRLQESGRAADNFWSEHGVHRLLVVGENMNEAARICALLRDTGLDTEYTASGYGALQLAEQANMEDRNYDLFLMDRDIQDKGYWEVADEIRAMAWTKIPAIILMSDKAEHFTQNVHKAGIAAIMPKPFFFSTFRKIVEDLGLDKEGEGAGIETVETNPLAGLRFLVAEDNTINADVLKELLEVEGARCEIAGNGKAAVAMFRNSRPGYYDMILMDIRMPLMDGYEATAAIRSLPKEDAATVPILAMTADTMEEDVERAFACGMNAHIPKPLNIQVLNQAVHKLREKRGEAVR
ncbi:MAG: response regulator [Lachnospiraceae bacterium]|nr:response regulator [Lachnospiraceae bacterium]